VPLLLSLSLSRRVRRRERRGGKRGEGEGENIYEVPTPTSLSACAWHSINSLSLSLFLSPPSLSLFSVGTATKSLPKPIDCHIPAGRKNEPANVPGLLTRPSAASGNFRAGKVNICPDRADRSYSLKSSHVIPNPCRSGLDIILRIISSTFHAHFY